jgi:hypothetical protein
LRPAGPGEWLARASGFSRSWPIARGCDCGRWPSFERIRGRIDAEGVVVDGQLLTWDEFLQLLQPYEGCEFDLRIPLEPDW